MATTVDTRLADLDREAPVRGARLHQPAAWSTRCCRRSSRCPVFASDALSSVAYATGEILVALTLVTSRPAVLRDADRVRDRAADGDRRELVPADRACVPRRRRRLHRQQGQPGHAPRPRRGRGPAVRLHDDRRRLDRRGRVRDRVGVLRGRTSTGSCSRSASCCS